MLWKKTIEKDLLCPQKVEWLVEVTIPVIQAVPPPCLKEKEQFYCWDSWRITGALECLVAIECWDLLKGNSKILRKEGQWAGDGWTAYFFWHGSPLLDSRELLVDSGVTLTLVFFVDLCLLFHFFWDLELNQDVFVNFFEHLSSNVLFFWVFWKDSKW